MTLRIDWTFEIYFDRVDEVMCVLHESILASIDESYIDDESDDRYISTKYLEDIRYWSQIYPDIKARDDRLKISERIKQTQSEWKRAKLSEKRVRKCL